MFEGADSGLNIKSIDLMHNDITRLDARKECWFW